MHNTHGKVQEHHNTESFHYKTILKKNLEMYPWVKLGETI